MRPRMRPRMRRRRARVSKRESSLPILVGLTFGLLAFAALAILGYVFFAKEGASEAHPDLRPAAPIRTAAAPVVPDAPRGIPDEADDGMLDDDDLSDPPLPPADPREKQARAQAVKTLEARIGRDRMKELAQQLEEQEFELRERLGENEAFFEALEQAQAAFCQAHALTEVERDALEDEAIRAGWLRPFAGD